MSVTISAPPVVIGYAYAIRIAVSNDDAPAFPAGCRLRAEVRRFVYSAERIAELTTENGGLVRVDDQTVELRLTGSHTAAIDGRSVILDFVRTDLDPDVYQYVQIQLPVMAPVTRATS